MWYENLIETLESNNIEHCVIEDEESGESTIEFECDETVLIDLFSLEIVNEDENVANYENEEYDNYHYDRTANKVTVTQWES